jgi:hypothetical protein
MGKNRVRRRPAGRSARVRARRDVDIQLVDIQLPELSTDAGVLCRLMIAECENPGYSDYTEADAKLSFRLMQAVVSNRLQNNPSQFGAPGATTLTDIMTSAGQFQGFSKTGGQVQLSQPVSDRIDTVLSNANSGAPGAYYQFVQDVIAQATGPVNDPFSGLTAINGTAVQGGTYGWRTVGSGDPGGLFFPIPATAGGVVLGNQFYTLVPQSQTMQDVPVNKAAASAASFRSGPEFLAFLQSVGEVAGRVALRGYVRKSRKAGFLSFARNPGSDSWSEIEATKIRQVEYYGAELHNGAVYTRVLLIL